MKRLEDKIRECGEVREGGIVKVDYFLNHRIDVAFLGEIGQEFHRLFKDTCPDVVMTLEASGIAIALATAQTFGVPVIFAKKSESLNLDKDCYVSEVYSYTRQKSYKIKLSKRYLNKGMRVLIVDDFLARGNAVEGMLELCRQAGAEVCGVGIVIEKCFQEGGASLRAKGVEVKSLDMISSIDLEKGIEFAPNPTEEVQG